MTRYPPTLPVRVAELGKKADELRKKKNRNRKKRRALRIVETLKEAVKHNL